jgi:hypothetical protein
MGAIAIPVEVVEHHRQGAYLLLQMVVVEVMELWIPLPPLVKNPAIWVFKHFKSVIGAEDGGSGLVATYAGREKIIRVGPTRMHDYLHGESTA